MPSYESSMRNLAKARAKMRPPRPWRSRDESHLIGRYVFLWFTSRGQKPSGREWARQLCISHTWLQKLAREFQGDSTEMYFEVKRHGYPNYAQLVRAREYTQALRGRGEVRPVGRAKQIDDFLIRRRD